MSTSSLAMSSILLDVEDGGSANFTTSTISGVRMKGDRSLDEWKGKKTDVKRKNKKESTVFWRFATQHTDWNWESFESCQRLWQSRYENFGHFLASWCCRCDDRPDPARRSTRSQQLWSGKSCRLPKKERRREISKLIPCLRLRPSASGKMPEDRPFEEPSCPNDFPEATSTVPDHVWSVDLKHCFGWLVEVSRNSAPTQG